MKIYRCVDENGNVKFTNTPGPGCTLLPGFVEKKQEAPQTSLKKIYRCVDENGKVTFTTKPGPGCTLLQGSVEKKQETSKTSMEINLPEVEVFLIIIVIIFIIFLCSKRYSRIQQKRGSKTKSLERERVYGERQIENTFKTKVSGGARLQKLYKRLNLTAGTPVDLEIKDDNIQVYIKRQKRFGGIQQEYLGYLYKSEDFIWRLKKGHKIENPQIADYYSDEDYSLVGGPKKGIVVILQITIVNPSKK